MKNPTIVGKPSNRSLTAVSLLLIIGSLSAFSPLHAEEMAIPDGYHRMPNGDIMANSPATAVVPAGYTLTANGVLKKLDEAGADSAASGTTPPPLNLEIAEASADTTDEDKPIPPGFHRMPDGTLMANSPANANVPEGFHMMPDGTLMPNAGGGHHHGAGMWMFDYNFMRMYMKDMLDTTTDVTPEQILDPTNEYNYAMSPTDMTMDMHMFMAMYGFTDKVMGMLMVHYMSNEMGMIGGTGVDRAESTMKTSGFADTIVSAMIQVPYDLTLNVGVSIPTGKIDNAGPMVHNANARDENVRYPYGMQLGSGTYDLVLGVDYIKNMDKFAFGANYQYVLRTGTNSEDYTLGDMMVLGGHVKYNATNELSTSAKLQFKEVGQIEGEDKVIRDEPVNNKNMSPSMDVGNYGGRRLDVGLGVKYQLPKMVTIGAEYTVPVYQNLFGPQMATQWIAGISVGVMFH